LATGQGLGWLRAEKDVDAGDWYFKAHFFQDPVQPGSLGVQAM
jgi:3-hydroxymyristoyl/3-hydroxydecanoyl-(acyl carrier protein) dehydratase